MSVFSNGFLLSLSLCLDIGVANIAMVNLAMHRGFTHGFSLGLGTCVGDFIYALLAMWGMSLLLQYESVRLTLWIGGTAVLVFFCYKMIRAAYSELAPLAGNERPQGVRGLRSSFAKGIFLAMSSPTAILWFAAVGGTLISRAGATSAQYTALFLTGFIAAGVFWSAVLCTLAYQGGKVLGERLLRYSYAASAAIFCYFAIYVVWSGYQEFVLKIPLS